ncbi:MAG TPA: biotin/lipoyl-binding protein, partial [Vicinamibacterales bacterium]|nr:biotin/lipoyl-binding protein [Vicinamibacterales bacterium]
MKRALLVLSLAAGLATAACGSNTSAAGTSGSSGGGGRGGRGRGADGSVAPVVTAKVAEKDVPVDIASIGNVEAFTTISVRSQVTGQLQETFFREGDFVKKDAPLFALDRRPFEAALAMAEANAVRDRALMAQAEAQLNRDAANAEYQQLTAERQAQLQARGIISKDMADQVRSQADATAALVKADKANVES